jgi:hypothetical protein
VTDVPPVVRSEVIVLGADAWLDGLPSLVAGLEEEWGIAVGGAHPDATEAFVAEATLADGRAKLVDPDGLLAEPEYDLGILMREDPLELLAGDPMDRARWLAAGTGLDADPIWEWGVVERVSTELLGLQLGLEPVARDMLHAADVVAR